MAKKKAKKRVTSSSKSSDISNKTLSFLVILVIVVSVVGIWFVINSDGIGSNQTQDVVGHVKLEVVGPQTALDNLGSGEVKLTIINEV